MHERRHRGHTSNLWGEEVPFARAAAQTQLAPVAWQALSTWSGSQACITTVRPMWNPESPEKCQEIRRNAQGISENISEYIWVTCPSSYGVFEPSFWLDISPQHTSTYLKGISRMPKSRAPICKGHLCGVHWSGTWNCHTKPVPLQTWNGWYTINGWYTQIAIFQCTTFAPYGKWLAL